MRQEAKLYPHKITQQLLLLRQTITHLCPKNEIHIKTTANFFLGGTSFEIERKTE